MPLRPCQKRYGGGPVKKDPDAEFGPQYDGPPIHYQIQRGPRLGFPKGGEQRVIPKLSGGSYDNRKRMMQNLTTELVRHGRIKTTRARAEALCFFVDRMILLAKRGDDLARREADEWMFDEKLVENLFKLAPERYPDQTKDFCKAPPPPPEVSFSLDRTLTHSLWQMLCVSSRQFGCATH
ncbi:unnamed protein product [Polarella glacialis]|uniref:39S ribosomal protein L17, mitochondrial n=1 Tax=Polarella glacialis TaxID=89957 RepID=A0A813ELX4_POLGL|nr:unnamed protein product [Polarella glacialis]